MLFRVSLESQHEDRLRVRSSDQAPAVLEQDARTVDRDNFIRRGKMFRDRSDDFEFAFVGTIDAELRCREGMWDISKQSRQWLVGF